MSIQKKEATEQFFRKLKDDELDDQRITIEMEQSFFIEDWKTLKDLYIREASFS